MTRVLPCSLALGFFSGRSSCREAKSAGGRFDNVWENGMPTHVSAWRREGCNPFDEFHRSLSGSFEVCGSWQTGLAAKEQVG